MRESSAIAPKVASLVLAPPLVLAILLAVAYHRAPENVFHFDDYPNISENPSVRVEHLDLESLRTAATASPMKNRGLAYISFAVDWWRGDGSPQTFQLTNLALHWVNALLVYALIYVVLNGTRALSNRNRTIAALLGAALWAVHPIQVQGVTYIVQRMAQLGCLFTILSVWLYILGRRMLRRGPAAVTFAAAALAMLCGFVSKENAWITPLLLVLAELGVVRRDRPLFRSGIERFVLVGLFVVLAFSFFATIFGIGPLYDRHGPGFEIRDFTMKERLLTQPRVILFHFSQILWPLPSRFSLEHDFLNSKSVLDPASTVVAIAVVALWVGCGFWWLTRSGARHVGFLFLWIPTTLVIESSFIALEMVYEHRMYLPSVGIFGLLAVLAGWLLRRSHRFGTTVIIASLIAIALLTASTMIRMTTWGTDLSLAENSVRHAPNSSRAWASLGMARLREGDAQGAESALRRSLELDPDNYLALEFMAVILMDRGQQKEAKGLLERAFIVGSDSVSLLNHMGELLMRLGEYERAEPFFRDAIEKKPWVAANHWNRALTLEEMGRCGEALEEWRVYLKMSVEDQDRAAVQDHLRERYETLGGRCDSD